MHRTFVGLAFFVGCSATEPAETDVVDDSSSSSGSGSTGASGERTSPPDTGTPSTGGSSGSAETTAQSATDGSTTGDETLGESDGSSSGGVELACARLATPDGPVEIGGTDSTTRIHPFLAFDGEGIWFAYADVEPAGSLFDIIATKLRCDGTAWVEAETISTNVGNDIDPSIAIVQGQPHVVWTSDDGTGGTSNLQIFKAVLGRDGGIETAATKLTTAIDGVDITQNHTSATTTPRGDDWVIAGVRAHPITATFQAFVQTLDVAGSPTREAWDASEPSTSHLGVAVAADAEGGVVVAHTRATDSDEDVWLTREGTAPETGAEAFPAFATTSQPALATDPSVPGAGYVAALAEIGGELDVVVSHYAASLEVSDAVRVGAAGRPDHNPVLVVGSDGNAALVYHRNMGGLSNDVVFARLAWTEEAGVTAGEEQTLASGSPPYPPAMTSLEDGRFMVAWAQGDSPVFTTWAQVLAARP